MKHKPDILDKARSNNAGMTVPEGYFADFNRRMAASLPDRPELDSPLGHSSQGSDQASGLSRSFWQKIRPYVYMAAMFAGIWLMLQLFALISHPGDLRPMESNPVMAEALSNDDFMIDYIINDAGVDQWDILDQMVSEDSIDFSDFSSFNEDEAPEGFDFDDFNSHK